MFVSHRDTLRRNLLQRGNHRSRIGGVGHQEDLVIADVVGDQVVDHTSVRCAAQRVLRPAGADATKIIGERGVDEFRGARTDHQSLAEMADIKQPDRVPGSSVLADRARVGHRHQPATKGREGGSPVAVSALQRAVE